MDGIGIRGTVAGRWTRCRRICISNSVTTGLSKAYLALHFRIYNRGTGRRRSYLGMLGDNRRNYAHSAVAGEGARREGDDELAVDRLYGDYGVSGGHLAGSSNNQTLELQC